MSKATNLDQLTDQVRELLGELLQRAGFSGCEELARQVSSVSVTGGSITMLELRTADTQAAAIPDGPIPLSMLVSDGRGDAMGELLIWVTHGFLSNLEFAWWTEDGPDQLPSSNRVRVSRK